jgi:hypothetical protein
VFIASGFSGYVFKGGQCYIIVLRGKGIDTYSLIKKGLVVGIILLFIDVAIAPSILPGRYATM